MNKNYEKIVDIKPIGLKSVWDIEVEEDHSYLANGGIINHNSNSPNMQNVPSEENHLDFNAGVKACIIPTHSGNVFLDVDFSGLELRLAAAFSGDPNMISAFQEGQKDPSKADIHRHIAAVIYSVVEGRTITYEEVTKEQRKTSKTTNFGILYGSSKKSIAEALGKTIQEVDIIFDALFVNYPYLKKFINTTRKQLLDTGKISNVFGMEYKLLDRDTVIRLGGREPENNKENGFVFKALREAVNYRIQGPGGMLGVMCGAEIQKALESKSYPAGVRLTVHDSILVECPEPEAVDVYENIVRAVMLRSRPWLNEVPLDCDCKIGKMYGCMVDYEEWKDGKVELDKKLKEYITYHSNFENFKKELLTMEEI